MFHKKSSFKEYKNLGNLTRKSYSSGLIARNFNSMLITLKIVG